MAVKRVLITGIYGYISQYLLRFKPNNVEVYGTARRQYDRPLPHVKTLFSLDLFQDVQQQLDSINEPIDVIIHTAAESKLAVCEKQPELALRVNARATGELAAWCQLNKVRLIYLRPTLCLKATNHLTMKIVLLIRLINMVTANGRASWRFRKL